MIDNFDIESKHKSRRFSRECHLLCPKQSCGQSEEGRKGTLHTPRRQRDRGRETWTGDMDRRHGQRDMDREI